MNRTQPSSMSDSFHAHGLAGIDLHHTATRRAEERIADRITRATGRSNVGVFRQHLGSLMIALGNHLAGQNPVQPRTARFV
jgi:hypothetical protein